MSVEVWYGDRPHHAAEQKTLLKLYQYLYPQQEHFVLLHNLFAGRSNEIDLVVLKRDGVFLEEREFALKDNSIVRFGPAAYTLLLHEDKEP